MFLNTTFFVSPGLITSIVCVCLIGAPCFWIVSVTGMLLSRLSPVSCTATSKASSVVATTLLSLDSERTRSCGSAVVETIPVPCRPPLVPVGVAAPFRRLNIAEKVAALTRSTLLTNWDWGTTTPLMPCSLRT